jgi:hypothetical protein
MQYKIKLSGLPEGAQKSGQHFCYPHLDFIKKGIMLLALQYLPGEFITI